jgi:hypothetical protein
MTVIKVGTMSPASQDMTVCPSGAFETSACLDAEAAIMRNATRPIGVTGRDWNINHAGTPTVYPMVTDKPVDLDDDM